MIGYLQGQVMFSDGIEVILLTSSGIGYQVHSGILFPEGKEISLHISHVIRESSQELYGFVHLKEKKLFELLTSVKGVGPKSAYSLIQSLGFEIIVQSVQTENKKTLSSAPGIGPKAAAQICLDLSIKIKKVCIYLDGPQEIETLKTTSPTSDKVHLDKNLVNQSALLNETIMACKELGFKDSEVESMAIKLLANHNIDRPEQLVHLILKEM